MAIDISFIPESSGVYLMKSAEGVIIYVGKAKNLKRRVSSYFENRQKDIKTQALVQNIDSFEVITTQTEAEAFLLENTLIKKHQPYYNIDLKDNKSYPYIAVDENEYFPRIYKTRETHRKGVKYFGPYARGSAADDMIKIGVKYFKLRLCSCKIKSMEEKKPKPCLYYHIGKCPGYCQWNKREDEYKSKLKHFIQLLNGRYSQLERELKEEMLSLSKFLEFEKAAAIRDLYQTIIEIKEKQKVYLSSSQDIDVFGCYEDESNIFFTLLYFREGRLTGKRTFKLSYSTDKELILSQMLSRFYEENFLPERIYIPFPIENQEEISEFVSELRKQKIEILNPQSGTGASLLKMASENAKYEFLMDQKMTQKELVLKRLKELLGLSHEPRRIEGYDIATVEGKWSAGVSVSFFNGRPDKKNYRHYRINYKEGQDDYAMLEETLDRRLNHGETAIPDLILIDGGKGQLNAALKVLVERDIQIPLISLAKKEELIFIPHRDQPVNLDIQDPALMLLMAVRDEAHRFANRLHNKMRIKTVAESKLQKIQGIGPKRRKALLSHFGSLENLLKATPLEIQKIAKITPELAQKILNEIKTKS